MKIKFKTSTFKSAVACVVKAAAKRSTIAALEGISILADASTNTAVLTGYNLEVGIRTEVPVVVQSEGGVVVNAKLFENIIKNLPSDISEDENATLEVKDSTVRINAGDSKYKIVAIPFADFPELPNISEGKTLKVKASDLKMALNATTYAVSTSDARPILTGVLFDLIPDKQQLKLVALDGFRLAVCTVPASYDAPSKLVIPASSLSEVEHLLPNNDNIVDIAFTRRHVTLSLNNGTYNYVVVSRLIEGEFFDYNRAIPDKTSPNALHIKVNPRRIVETSERMSLLINDCLKTPIKCTVADGKLDFDCKTAIGSAADSVPAEMPEGASLCIGFNNRYMLESFKNIINSLKLEKDEIVTVNLFAPTSPLTVEVDKQVLDRLSENNSSDYDFLAMLLPVRLAVNA